MRDRPLRQIFDTSSDLSKTLVIIPVLNEEKNIVGVIKSLQSYGLSRIRVVDNGSQDRSRAVAKDAGAEVLDEPVPGYGQACWQGLQNIPQEVNWILFCDGDGSDDLSCLPEFFSLRDRYDLILGDRRATASGKAVMTPVQNFGNGLAGSLIYWGWGHKYDDLGPLRLIRRSAIEQIAMKDRGFGWTVEMQVRAVEEGLKICEIPVSYRPRQGGRSKISGTISGSFQAGTIILGTLGKLYLSRSKRPKSQLYNSADLPIAPTITRDVESRNSVDLILIFLSAFFLCLGAVMATPYGDFRQAANVVDFGYGIAVMGLGFALSWNLKSLNAWWFWLVTILTRVILLFISPGDDIWRYIWEGYIQTQGFNPYHFAPNAAELITYHFEWWSKINHPSVSAIYPPLTQLGFRILATISPSVIFFKSSFMLADIVICWLLSKKFTYLQTSLYAWNPLVIYSFAGGGHYDSWFILPLVVAWLWWEKPTHKQKKDKRSSPIVISCLIGISIAVKWISLPILGFLSWVTWRKINLKTAFLVGICGVLPIVLTSLSFCSADACSLIPTSSTFVSHGRSAEFLPHLLAKLWQPSVKINSIFALPLGLISLIILFVSSSFQQFALGFFTSLLIISPIIHSWYFTWIIPFAVGTKNWGVRLGSLSAFVYFILPYRQALGDRNWNLTDMETWLLWLPFILGFVWSFWRSKLKPTKNQVTE